MDTFNFIVDQHLQSRRERKEKKDRERVKSQLGDSFVINKSKWDSERKTIKFTLYIILEVLKHSFLDNKTVKMSIQTFYGFMYGMLHRPYINSDTDTSEPIRG